MAETLTLARPYAKAVYTLAHAQQDLDKWGAFLNLLAGFLRNSEVQVMLADPRVPVAARAEAVLGLCERARHKPDPHERNFVRLLAQHRRLPVLPEIASEYAALREQAERLVEVEMRAAAPVSEAERNTVRAALEKKLGRKVKLSCVTDASLIGGAVLRAGDLVIDGSVRGKLGRLANAIVQ
ncbi:MAG: F0F1 ATP synthase subunit delta [Gammaproteobacteria bacterium]